MYTARMETSSNRTDISWTDSNLEELKKTVNPHFHFMKNLQSSKLLKGGIYCIRFYKDEEFICQWGSW